MQQWSSTLPTEIFQHGHFQSNIHNLFCILPPSIIRSSASLVSSIHTIQALIVMHKHLQKSCCQEEYGIFHIQEKQLQRMINKCHGAYKQNKKQQIRFTLSELKATFCKHVIHTLKTANRPDL